MSLIEAFKTLAGSNPAPVVAELKSRLQRLDVERGVVFRDFERDVDSGHEAAGHAPTSVGVSDAVARLARIADRRRDILVKLAAVDATAVPAEDETQAAQAFRIMTATSRGPDVLNWCEGTWRRMVSEAIAGESRAKADVASAAVDTGDVERRAQALAAAAEDAVKQRHVMKTLLYDPDSVRKQAAAAVDAGGGFDALRTDLRDALIAVDRFDDGFAADTTEAVAARLDVVGKRLNPKGRLAERHKGRIAAAKAEAKQARVEAAARAEAALENLADGLLRGEASAVQEVRRLASEVPDAFAAEFLAELVEVGTLRREQIAAVFSLFIRD